MVISYLCKHTFGGGQHILNAEEYMLPVSKKNLGGKLRIFQLSKEETSVILQCIESEVVVHKNITKVKIGFVNMSSLKNLLSSSGCWVVATLAPAEILVLFCRYIYISVDAS